jgi:chromosome partitioning protein
VASDEVWHFYEGAPLELFVAAPDVAAVERVLLGSALETDGPVFTVPSSCWQAARPTGLPLLTLMPASRELVGAEIELVNVEKREYLLAGKLDALEGEFDYVLVDCPPSLGLLTLNALTAVDGVIVPIQCEYYALEGVSELVSTIEKVRENLNPRLGIAGVVATMWDERLNLSRQVLEEIRRHFGEAFLEPAVPRNVRLGEAPSFGKPIFLYDVRSRGAEAYLAIARELLRRDLAAEAGGRA